MGKQLNKQLKYQISPHTQNMHNLFDRLYWTFYFLEKNKHWMKNTNLFIYLIN